MERKTIEALLTAAERVYEPYTRKRNEEGEEPTWQEMLKRMEALKRAAEKVRKSL